MYKKSTNTRLYVKIGSIGGCCLVYMAHHICFYRLKSLESSDMEGIWLKIMPNLTTLALGSVYRPPSDFAFS